MPAFLTPEQLKARNRRSLWIAAGLVGFIVLIFLTTFLRMQSNLQERKALNAPAAAEAPR